jgi:RNA polymerase sigma factor (sigma-70 family)
VQERSARLAWFKTIILPHESALRRRVRRWAAPDTDVDDVVAEVLTRAYTTGDWQRIDQGRGFLFAVARNLMVDAARRRAVVSFDMMADMELLNVADEAPTAEAAASARDELRQLQAAVDALPPQCRKVFLLRRVEERSPADIAAQLGLSISTVEKHLAKGMAYVTQALADTDPLNQSLSRSSWQDAKHKR